MSDKNKEKLTASIEINLTIAFLCAFVNGKITQDDYDNITEALKPFIIKQG